MLKASICIATHNKPHLLAKTLESIYAQSPPFEFEVIVVDDGPKDNAARDVCSGLPVLYHRIEREHVYLNPCVARNVGFKLARADVIIAQSDEVLHMTPDCIERLVLDLVPGHMIFANVFCLDEGGNECGTFIGPTRRSPFFFLGSLYRADLYAVGGNDEEFIICPAYEDDWFGDCLTRGRGLIPIYRTNIVGHHLFHEYFSPEDTQEPSRSLYRRKRNDAEQGKIKFESSGGPWPYVPNQPYESASTEEVFTSIHRRGHWGDGESASGVGSSVDATREIRSQLPRLIRDLNIHSILDIPCGDWHWMKWTRFPDGIKYIGADIVWSLVESLKPYTTDERAFCHLDLLKDDLPEVDLVFCRDCLGHFSNADAGRALTNIARSGSKYLLATTFPNKLNTKVIQTGDWAPYNLQVEPFNLPEPLEIINEDCREYYPDFNDKSLGLWRIDDSLRVPE